MHRTFFETHILLTHKARPDRDILERSADNEDDYLDLYVHYEWLGWKAAVNLYTCMKPEGDAMRLRYSQIKMLHVSLGSHMWHWRDVWYLLTGRV